MLREQCWRFRNGLFSEKLQSLWQLSPQGKMLSCSWPEWRTAEVNVLHTDQHPWHIMCFCTILDIYTDRSYTASLPGRAANNDRACCPFQKKISFTSDLGASWMDPYCVRTVNVLSKHWSPQLYIHLCLEESVCRNTHKNNVLLKLNRTNWVLKKLCKVLIKKKKKKHEWLRFI